jgi:hypothetical protein
MKPKDFHLKFPQWQGGEWIIGLGSYLFNNSNTVHVYCDYRKKNGTRLWDGYLVCTKQFASKYPLIPLQKNPKVKLYRVPYQELLTFHNSITDSTEPLVVVEEHKENKRLAGKREAQYIEVMYQQRHKWNPFEIARAFVEQPNAPIYVLEGKGRYECAGSVIEPYDNRKPS